VVYDPQTMSLLLPARLNDAVGWAGNQLSARRDSSFGGS